MSECDYCGGVAVLVIGDTRLCEGCAVPSLVARLRVELPDVGAPCPGCGADAGERCRWWCLSRVTDDAGQPVEVSLDPYGETPEEAAVYLANGIRYLDEWAADIELQMGGEE